MKAQEIILAQFNSAVKLQTLLGAFPEDTEFASFTSSRSIRLSKVVTLKVAEELLRSVRQKLGFISKLSSYHLGDYWPKKGSIKECLQVSWKIGSLTSIDDWGKTFTFTIDVKYPKAALKGLGVTCKIKTVKEPSYTRAATERRKVVCSIAA